MGGGGVAVVISIAIVLILCVTVMVVVESIIERRPLSLNVYLEKRRVLERDRAEWMASQPSHSRDAARAAIDKKLLELAERMPEDMDDDDDDEG